MKFVITTIIAMLIITSSAEINILENTPAKIILELTPAEYQLVSGSQFTNINILWAAPDLPGSPNLPFKSFNISVPPQGEADYRIISMDVREVDLSLPIAPVPEFIKGKSTYDYNYRIDPELYRITPQDFLEKNQKTRFLFYEIVPFHFRPFQYNYQANNLLICEKMIVEITLNGNTGYSKRYDHGNVDLYEGFILNYSSAGGWQSTKQLTSVKMPFELSAFWYSFQVDGTGYYQLSDKELQMLPSYCDPELVRIFTMSKYQDDDPNYQLKEIPLQIEAGSDHSFDQGDRIIFENISDRKPEIFWLTFGTAFPGLPLRVDDLIPDEDINSVTEFIRKTFKARSARDQVNCMIIYPEVFSSQVEELAQFNSERFGLENLLAEQQDIFDVYSGGQPDPVAIRDSIESCLQLHPELEYVILVGSGTNVWDNSNPKNKIITFFGKDDNFVTFNNGVTAYPELSISRLPAQNQDQLEEILNRTRNYVEQPNLGWWRNQLLLLPDDENKNGGFEGTGDDDGMNHTMRSELTANILNHSISIDKLYTIEYPLDSYQNKPSVTEDLIEKINEGRLIWYFIGHGDYDVLGDEEYFRTSKHLRLIDNMDHLPLFLAASCSVGEFDIPDFDCTAERMLTYSSGGSIASIAASRACGPINNTLFMIALLDQIINNRISIGRALFMSKLFSDAAIQTANLYNLLGHPLLPIVPPARSELTEIPEDWQARKTINLNGNFTGTSGLTTEQAEIRIYDSEYFRFYENIINEQVYSIGYRDYGNTFFKGYVNVETDNYSAAFVIPDDIRGIKEITPLTGFYFIGEQIVPVGFITPGDKSSEINKNYFVKILSPGNIQLERVESIFYEGDETYIKFDNYVENFETGIENFQLFLDTGGKIVVYAQSDTDNNEYVNYYYPVDMNKIPLNIDNPDIPSVKLMLDSRKFKDNDYVSTKPVLIADLEDQNGINILGSSGHKMLIVIDDEIGPFDVTSGFFYDLNSYTKGVLTWQLPEMEEGHHTLRLVVFDNFNAPSIADTEFISRKSGKVSIEQMLPYPNPMKTDGYFTFIITEAAEITLSIYTITGKKIRTIKKFDMEAGYNQIYWNGLDQDGDELANNTYFYKITAKQLETDKKSEKIGKFVMLK
ncbi:MAG: hypothetical protein JW996_05375 [Candidatus Cloacimonetes bacterium]|nr:hypothetical protein [Candidatus Cloacimonadota bacterium]